MIFSRLYILIVVLSRFFDQVFSRLQLAHLKASGAVIGKNVVLKKNCKISLARKGKLFIGNDVIIDRYTDIIVYDGATMVIGDRVYIGKFSTLSAENSVSIGSESLIAHNVSVLDSNHAFREKNLPIRTQGSKNSPIAISENSWIGSGAVILPGVKLETKTVVGANSVVTKSFSQENVVLAGAPAVIINDT